jgi:hypothetical protein
MGQWTQIEGSLRRMLEAAAGSRNRVSVADLRDWALEYLHEYANEVARFPGLIHKPHWNLWIPDSNRESESLFVIMVFRSSGIEVACGTGENSVVRAFGESEFPDDTEAVVEAASERFEVQPDRVSISRELAEIWLGSHLFPKTVGDRAP